MLSVRIRFNNLFIFSVSTLTFFQSRFLRDGYVIFGSLMICFIGFTFFLSSFNVDVEVLGSVMFLFSVFRISINLENSL